MCLTKIPLGEDKKWIVIVALANPLADNPPATEMPFVKKNDVASSHRSEFADLKNMPMIPRGDLKVSTLKRLMDRCDPISLTILIYFKCVKKSHLAAGYLAYCILLA